MLFCLSVLSLAVLSNSITIDIPTSLEGTVQSVRITGKLTCNGVPMEKVKIKLYEKELILDVLLDEEYTDSNGNFTVQGTKTEFSWIEPKVNIYHKCNYDGECYRRFNVKVPKEYISQSTVAEKTFDIGSVNLDSQFSGESTDCFN